MEKDARLYKNELPKVVKQVIDSDPKTCWLDADLSGCSGVKVNFGDSDRYINCGVSEANMAGIAAGMASNDMKPYVHTFGAFASRRMFDQVFLSAGYANNPITVIGTDPGITAAFNGGTHMPFEDTALYRTLPNAIICDCVDIPMMNSFVIQAKDLPGVKYMRIPRKDSVKIYDDNEQFVVGKGEVLKEGSRAVVIASGIMVAEAMNVEDVTVIDPFTIKPLDVELIKEYAKKQGKVVVAENHNKIGGLVSAVAEAIVGIDCKFGCVAVEDEFGEVGPLDYLRERYDLTSEHIDRVVKEL